MNLQDRYNREGFLGFLQEFIPNFKRDIRSVDVKNLKVTREASYLGECTELDLPVFELTHSSSNDARVALATDGFKMMKVSATFRALIVYRADGDVNWRLSLMTASPDVNQKGEIGLTFSNPRRLSFFLGPNAKINTPSRFLIKQGSVKDFEDLQRRFSLEVVNEEFYKTISEHFVRLVGGALGTGKKQKAYNSVLRLPAVAERSQTSLEFAVRLIGRVIFCWFLREKRGSSSIPLVPKELLSFDAVTKLSDYYHKVLEPIFFEVLNKPIKSRRSPYFDEPFSLIPYLNGGLFSPHDDDFFSYNEGRQAIYHNAVKVPDEWIKSLFEILETYNFTIDENTSFDEELSIDPEMLGRIFENLLAEINPETGETARKRTGSFYTPRMIVDYMVDESLVVYLKEKTHIDKAKLRAVVSYDLTDDADHPLNDDEKKKIIDALDRLKLLDPACGSGAFPIGALQKIVFVLQQVDPDGQLWFRKQLVRTSPELRRVIEREFEHQNFDYIRKLGIIRENIFGVDIQSIATEMSRLRCFLTLVVDERVDDSLENRGVEPLPNLDFKFVTANSLIGLPLLKKQGEKENIDWIVDDLEKIDELRLIRDQYFTASGIEREQLKTSFVTAQKKLVDQLIVEHGYMGLAKAQLTQMLANWEPFSHRSSTWFDPEWMFGICDGFDITIGNPPYVRADEQSEWNKRQRVAIIDSRQYETLWQNWDLYIPFIEKSYKMLKPSGVSTLIVSDAFCHSKYAQKSQNWFLKNAKVLRLDFLSKIQIFDAAVRNVTYFFQKNDGSRNKPERRVHDAKFGTVKLLETDEQVNLGYRCFFPEDSSPIVCENDVIFLKEIFYIAEGMHVNSHEKKSQGEFKMEDVVVATHDSIHPKPFVEGKHLGKWLPVTNRWLEWGTNRAPSLFRRQTFPEVYEVEEKILVQRSPGPDPKCCYDNGHFHYSESTIGFSPWISLKNVRNRSLKKVTYYKDEKPPSADLPKREQLEKVSCRFDVKYLLAVMNSSVARSILRGNRRSNIHLYSDDWKKLPIPDVQPEKQAPIVALVDLILEMKRNDPSADISTLEAKVDSAVSELYGLTSEENNAAEEGEQ